MGHYNLLKVRVFHVKKMPFSFFPFYCPFPLRLLVSALVPEAKMINSSICIVAPSSFYTLSLSSLSKHSLFSIPPPSKYM